MRMQHVLTFIGAAALSLSAAAAPGTIADSNSAKAGCDKPSQLLPGSYDRMQGDYKLEDGRTLRVTGEDRKLYVDLGDGKTELVPVSRYDFKVPAKNLRVSFDRMPAPEFVKVTPAG